MKVLVTGASGFIGHNLCSFLRAHGYSVRGAVRNNACRMTEMDEAVCVGDVGEKTDWQEALAGIDIVVHLAARVHVMRELQADSLRFFREVNVRGTERLARGCVQAGVRRFVFLSSVGVHGDFTRDKPFTEDDRVCPVTSYAISKWEAEQALFRVARGSGMQAVVLRAPLVYGVNAPGNFSRLLGLIKKGIPMPFGNINNQRSFVFVGNLVDAITLCMVHHRAANETFLVSDSEDVSTLRLLEMIALALNKKLVLFRVPLSMLRIACALMGKRRELDKLVGSLCVDPGKIKTLLGWKPPFSMEEGIKASVK